MCRCTIAGCRESGDGDGGLQIDDDGGSGCAALNTVAHRSWVPCSLFCMLVASDRL